MHVYEMHGYGMHACGMHAYEVYALGRSPMRYTPVRCTPMTWTPLTYEHRSIELKHRLDNITGPGRPEERLNHIPDELRRQPIPFVCEPPRNTGWSHLEARPTGV